MLYQSATGGLLWAGWMPCKRRCTPSERGKSLTVFSLPCFKSDLFLCTSERIYKKLRVLEFDGVWLEELKSSSKSSQVSWQQQWTAESCCRGRLPRTEGRWNSCPITWKPDTRLQPRANNLGRWRTMQPWKWNTRPHRSKENGRIKDGRWKPIGQCYPTEI